MKPYLLSAAAGLLVGIVYAVINVRSPAPPVIALVGLLGILVGEQLPPLARQLMQRGQSPGAWLQEQVKPHMFGHLPQCKPPAVAASTKPSLEERHDG
ncbi:XapX domain-containing protein [Xylophilus sp. GOD-11R]|uniref:XapX domain-containing protein n=1 Tax=Xylophilus sp. GOD-11R TaxID=3089814 RepID=UPI00298C2F0E|nr:XapX domain-containing protein [Xylophilus sp. GOD-11R]WPB56291.1 XapX domain-containing protein [Xylophilus sp. GOD-11R]